MFSPLLVPNLRILSRSVLPGEIKSSKHYLWKGKMLESALWIHVLWVKTICISSLNNVFPPIFSLGELFWWKSLSVDCIHERQCNIGSLLDSALISVCQIHWVKGGLECAPANLSGEIVLQCQCSSTQAPLNQHDPPSSVWLCVTRSLQGIGPQLI
jgi:hypothetical protein